MIYMFLSNNPSSGDINSLNLPCLSCFKFHAVLFNLIHVVVYTYKTHQIFSFFASKSDILIYRCFRGNTCIDCRSRGREFDPGQVPYFRGD